MKNYRLYGMTSNLKYTLLSFFNKNKIKIIIIGCVFLIALMTGVFTSIKIYNIESDFDFGKYSMYTLVDGGVYNIGAFFLRIVSMVIVAVLLCLFSVNGFLSVFGYILVSYRVFLLGMNCSLIIIRFGLSGILNSILIIFPCQLLAVLVLGLFFIFIRDKKIEMKKCGETGSSWLLKIFLYVIGIFLIISLVEFLLLLIFKPTTILII